MTPIPLYAAYVGTPAFWRSAAPSFGVRTWRSAMRRFAAQHGRAVAHMADDSAEIVERTPEGRLRDFVVPADAVRWSR